MEISWEIETYSNSLERTTVTCGWRIQVP